ncbi:TetR/AcrR family transcriptional regulator [Solirubrobacter soli]|uniref:TetR/AcrR family transcriptional regulator n=1 Tax=Solirubrobacter soli TaxID=363832 RepID=UPI0004151C28|nr:TetR/AcrR family transcriptional regulator [Solirubrobacter soli]
MSGRRAEAARNDERILASARAVFLADPSAPIAAVAKHAGVGVGALYRRYAGKDQLLQTLCADGLHRFIAVAEHALDQGVPADECLDVFITGIVDADVHSLTVKLAGTFPTTMELYELATHAHALNGEVLARARAAGAVRADLDLNDIPMIFEQLAAIRLGDPERNHALRRRYLALHLSAIRPDGTPLPGTPPTDEEHRRRWERR